LLQYPRNFVHNCCNPQAQCFWTVAVGRKHTSPSASLRHSFPTLDRDLLLAGSPSSQELFKI
jgi:hypothetical protein